MIQELSASPEAAGDVVQVLRSLADPTRLRLLSLLPAGEMNVSELCERLGAPQPTVSHHLGLLRAAGLVSNRRRGKQVYYSLNPEVISRVRAVAGEGGGLSILAGPIELRVLGNTPGGNGGGRG